MPRPATAQFRHSLVAPPPQPPIASGLPRFRVAPYPPAMGHRGSRNNRGIILHYKEEEAKRAQQVADRLACEAWVERLQQLGGPLQPSPSLRAAINGGFPFLRVECNACQQSAWVDLRNVRRPPATPLWKLEASLVCDPCRRHTRFPPRARIDMLCRHDGERGAPRHQDRD
jgi:hypothetical protein